MPRRFQNFTESHRKNFGHFGLLGFQRSDVWPDYIVSIAACAESYPVLPGCAKRLLSVILEIFYYECVARKGRTRERSCRKNTGRENWCRKMAFIVLRTNRIA